MQNAAVPELAHTHARPVHWLATAAAMAGVVALAGWLQPEAAKASQGAPGARVAAAPAPDTAAVVYPLQCGSVGTRVASRATGDLDGDGSPETVAVVHCRAGSGTPPSGIYVLTRPAVKGAPPRLVATLADPREKLSVLGLAVQDGAVTATLLGYSSASVPRCCPDQEQKAKWRWQGGKFVRSTQSPAPSI
ncbi:hypothetical protein A8W25_04500 [Streptomyces sp. ERV7]|uniref:hypothetical protein n=1 Tax=Streptomyces sp. ERV7 TaxID=1322334 RepID=UPI0007F4BF6E|nr:hypothetical protein [Streptomyces sp. ERV7]OAR27498.1 hypothetical protein A8W25_04500 [Streptomyces sp. ERV7]